jgi:hypothetical protein
MLMTGPKTATRPRAFTEGELKKVGVTIENPYKLWLSCDRCGDVWSPCILPGGRLPRGYWKCPQGCNETS